MVVNFRLLDAPRGERSWWLVVEHGAADLCRDDPGHEVTLLVESSVRALTEVWSGDRAAAEVVRAGEVRILGTPEDARAFWRWLGRSDYAGTREASRSPARAGRASSSP